MYEDLFNADYHYGDLHYIIHLEQWSEQEALMETSI